MKSKGDSISVVDARLSLNSVDQYIFEAKNRFNYAWKAPQESNATIDEFTISRTLGTGAFGRVLLVRHNKTNTYHAMKILNKVQIVESKQVEHTLTEKRILACTKFPFIVSLSYHFKDNIYLYVVMEFVAGGELFYHLRRTKRFPEDQTKFYVAQVILAFQFLHSMNILYRDLKPENVLVDNQGYIKLADLGFAKQVTGRTYTMCGTPEYIAPEVVKNVGYGKSVDWWAIGIFMYELFHGTPPFVDENQLELYRSILYDDVKFTSKFSKVLKHLISHILKKEISSRYGCLRSGIEDIRNHEWFRSLNWVALYHRTLIPPLIPSTKGPGDSSNFEKYEEVEFAKANTDICSKEFEDF